MPFSSAKSQENCRKEEVTATLKSTKASMEDFILCTFLSLLFLILTFKLYQSKARYKNIPPTPPSASLIHGHLHLLKPPVPRHFHHLSQKYGKIFSLWLGSHLVVVVSSSSAVEECFTKNDIVLANRPRLSMGKHVGYNYSTMSTASYGEHWRNLRRIGALDLFSSPRLSTFQSIRKDEVKRLLLKLSHKSTRDFAKVELKSMFAELTFNIIMREAAGKQYCDDNASDEEEAREFRDLIPEILSTAGASNQEDFLPSWNWIKRRNFEKRVKGLAKRSDTFLRRLVDKHRSKKGSLESTNTMIDHLLSLQEEHPEYYTDEIIKGFVQIALFGGTNTSAATLEWAVSNLVSHQDVLKKAKGELESNVGQERLIDESDLSNLPYLRGIILETLRLYPPIPLLIPHMASDDCTIQGYNIPRGTILLVNVWAIQRDPELWDDPTSFKPERFEGGSAEGDTYRLMPFGLGRRACPGQGMALRGLGLALGSLIQCFEWKSVNEKKVDMREGIGLTMPKLEPLEAMCKARPIMNKILSGDAGE